MEERVKDTDTSQAVEELGRVEDVLVEKPAMAKGARSKRVDDGPSEEPLPSEVDVSSDLEDGRPEMVPVVTGQVMRGVTIRELEMMPKMEDIKRLEEIPVGGTTNIEPEVIGAIAGVAAQSVEGVASLGGTSLRRALRERVGGAERLARGVEVEAGSREVILDISLRIIYGYSIPRTVLDLRRVVADRLLNLCGLIAKEINVRVNSIEFPERMPGRVR